MMTHPLYRACESLNDNLQSMVLERSKLPVALRFETYKTCDKFDMQLRVTATTSVSETFLRGHSAALAVLQDAVKICTELSDSEICKVKWKLRRKGKRKLRFI